MNIATTAPAPSIRTSSRHPSEEAKSEEGKLVDPPKLVRQHWEDDQSASLPFWASPSPTSDPTHELETLRIAWRELSSILASQSLLEAPEVFQMPTPPTRHITGKVRKIGPAPFVFVDDFLVDDFLSDSE